MSLMGVTMPFSIVEGNPGRDGKCSREPYLIVRHSRTRCGSAPYAAVNGRHRAAYGPSGQASFSTGGLSVSRKEIAARTTTAYLSARDTRVLIVGHEAHRFVVRVLPIYSSVTHLSRSRLAVLTDCKTSPPEGLFQFFSHRFDPFKPHNSFVPNP